MTIFNHEAVHLSSASLSLTPLQADGETTPDSTAIKNDRVAATRPTLGGTEERAFVLLADRRVADVGKLPNSRIYMRLKNIGVLILDKQTYLTTRKWFHTTSPKSVG